ncbi:hypothetical protein B0H11DRAFT_2056344 [Mycena galericulata]|nr:hypothetical protein B0H11DRAFT_2056344 [Mycena galericulata]
MILDTPLKSTPGRAPDFMSLQSHPCSSGSRSHRFEHRYFEAMQFLNDSFERYPLVSVALSIFVATSIIPVVVFVAVAVFSIWLAFATSIVALVGLVVGLVGFTLLLVVFLSIALLASVILTLLGTGASRLCTLLLVALSGTSGFTSRTDNSDAKPVPEAPTPSVFTEALCAETKDVFQGGNWKGPVAIIVISDILSRLTLPRVIRYSAIYRTLFGPRLFGPRHTHTHVLQRTLSLPSRIIAREGRAAPVEILMLLTAALILSPRLRAAARRLIARGAMLLSNSESGHTTRQKASPLFFGGA